MKQFFAIVFGGLFFIGAGMGVAYVAGWAWRNAGVLADIKAPSIAAVADAIIGQPVDGTSVSGFKRIIRYTADEEEDLISSAPQAMKNSAAGGVTARGYIVKNLTKNSTVISHNAEIVMPIASLTKLVTAAVARKLVKPNSRITVTRDIMTTYGNTAQFRVGEAFLAQDLYYPLLMVSSNDAAEALARDYGRLQFIQAMNDFTQSIGAYRTYFADPSGLSPENVSTANDIAIILDWIRRNDPDLIGITMLKSKTVKGHTWVNPTHFLNWSTYLGGKNGYIPEAGLTSASLFSLGPSKNVYAIVLLDSSSRDGDELRLMEKVK
ncbi:serine hydrolase [Patescibacteria group bacterium]|nr:serine hydrolase [Patescibacteria group bacterium]MDE1946965.1 D-alanyl-D-alanine carboxypeptidase [Patescibacteria group bacterium]MDE2011238.1 D-alanyl-D-alanine carboxypeptidase [Patescibacteria group bacterium]MDE2233402.1 D-alanyl-D-alanine carboxypeptidase [Patescibacteria group bacterium]